MYSSTTQQTSLTGSKDFRMLVFACKWCGFIAADGAGRKRIPLTPHFRLIPVECAASVEPDVIIRALADGIDGIAILGCHLGGCRYNQANHMAVKRNELLQDLFDIIGVDRRRLMVSWGTAHEPFQFERDIHRFQQILEKLPPMDHLLKPPKFQTNRL